MLKLGFFILCPCFIFYFFIFYFFCINNIKGVDVRGIKYTKGNLMSKINKYIALMCNSR